MIVSSRRSGLFTPDMAFEAIVKKQIERLKAPAIKCVDMVMNELVNIIKKCTDKVTNFSLFFLNISNITAIDSLKYDYFMQISILPLL